MVKRSHEIRDPIHNFIRIDSSERKLLDSIPVQRLRNIHQLGLTYLVYPGATHRRFEHSLGVMELAGRVYDIITNQDNIHDSVRPLVRSQDCSYWRKALKIAALCHDVGHLPFSHLAEGLLPQGWDHERLTAEIIMSDQMKNLIYDQNKVNPEDVAKLALGAEKYKKFFDEELDVWEAILSEIIVGDTFGVDRIDYLLRDSHHAGVAYGKFDHYRMIDTLRILPKSEASQEPSLGIEEGGLHTAEALLLARYFMFTQLYYHRVRLGYDLLLEDFLRAWLPEGKFSTDLNNHLLMTDNEVTAEIFKAADDDKHPGHISAKRILNRRHFKLIYQRNPEDVNKYPEAAKMIYEKACEKFGSKEVKFVKPKEIRGKMDFPILGWDNQIKSAISLSETLAKVPSDKIEYIFITPENFENSLEWLDGNKDAILQSSQEQEEEEDL